ncbi:MAG: hypothetical protein N4A62_06660 [Marinisporobacter sp.]|jgi:hypothetical protein|nr:hypothetical protein [Marinisporobacter sp.]
MIGGEHYYKKNIFDIGNNNSFYGYLTNIFNKNQIKFFSTGRDCIFSLFKTIELDTLWIPNYLCESILKSIEESKTRIKFYEIDSNLRIKTDFLNKMGNNDYVFVINYFGIIDYDFYEEAKKNNIKIISDITHSFVNIDKVSYVYKISHYVLGSFRKILAISDGAFVASINQEMDIEYLDCIREDFVTYRTHGLLDRYYCKENGFKSDENYYLLRKAEKILDETFQYGYKQSHLSYEILKRINLKKEFLQAKKNFMYFVKNISNNKYIKTLCNTDYISQYIVLKFNNKNNRDRFRKLCFENDIFLPVHWDTSFLYQNHSLSDLLLSVPCDSRYDFNDMNKIIRLIEVMKFN